MTNLTLSRAWWSYEANGFCWGKIICRKRLNPRNNQVIRVALQGPWSDGNCFIWRRHRPTSLSWMGNNSDRERRSLNKRGKLCIKLTLWDNLITSLSTRRSRWTWGSILHACQHLAESGVRGSFRVHTFFKFGPIRRYRLHAHTYWNWNGVLRSALHVNM